MRNKRPEGSIRQRAKDIFQIRYGLGIDPLTGKRKRIEVKHEGTYKSAKEELRRLLRTIDTNEHIDPNKIKVSEYLVQWLDTVRAQVSPKTHKRYEELVNYYLITELGGSRLKELKPSDIQKVYNKLETTGRKGDKSSGLAARTRLQIHRIFRTALKHAVRMRMISHNPVDDVMAPKIRKATVSTLTIEQSAALLNALKTSYPRMYMPVLLAVTTGMRRGEIVALRWKNVDLENNVIRVVESVEQVKQNIRFKAPKMDKARAVMLPDYVVGELKACKQKQAKDLAEEGVILSSETFVCCLWNGDMVKPDNLSAEFRTTIRKIPDFPIVRFHDLRHSHATQLLQEGIHPKIAQERLGHSSIKTTLDLYSHVTDTMQGEAVSKLDTAFRSAINAKLNLTPKIGGPKLG